jgi:hypothetical protein
MPVQGYEASIDAARPQLEAARAALSRDVAQAVAGADWAPLLREKYDVQALMEHIGDIVRQREFVGKLHAAADKARRHQPARGRPPKPGTDAVKTPGGQPGAGAANT